MIYYKYDWVHDFENEPVLFFVELDNDRWAQRILEVYRDGHKSYADNENEHGTFLGKEPYPSEKEINDGKEFFIVPITKEQFEIEWNNR